MDMEAGQPLPRPRQWQIFLNIYSSTRSWQSHEAMDPALLKQKEAFKKRAIDATKKSQEIREAASKAKQEVASKLPPKPVKKKKKKSILPRPSGNFTNNHSSHVL